MNKIVFILSVFIFIVLFFFIPFRLLVFNQSFYSYEQQKLGVFGILGENKTQNLTLEVINYLDRGSANLNNFNQREKDHLADVKHMIDWVFVIGSVAILLFILFCYFYSEEKSFSGVFIISGAIALTIIIIFMILFLLRFDYLFTLFHEIFFKPGTWTFDPSVEVIKQLFPNKFFSDFIMIDVVFTALLSAISILFGIFYKKAFKHRKNSSRK